MLQPTTAVHNQTPRIVGGIKWVMLISGLLTSSMVYAAIDPQRALGSMFGTTLEGPLAEVLVRNWGVLVTLVGLLLIYAAFNPQIRTIVVVQAAVSKAVFVALMLAYFSQYFTPQALFTIALDSVTVLVFGWYLLRVALDPTAKP
ncbi:MAG: hypothetical protein SFU83_13575 [Meiothermus sp.]|nr:hypothetical protein [Meiothermus sp.]